MEIRNLEHTDFDTLFSSFERAFVDYDIHFEKAEVLSMLQRRGYNPALSFAAFDKGEIVSFTLNGIGIFNGISTAYDTGTGTIMEYRGQGIAGKIFTHSIPFLKNAGVRQYLLEVLQNNQPAISVYQRMGFKIRRELYCFRQIIDKIHNPAVANLICTIEPAKIDFIRRAQTFGDFLPSWQNSIDSIERGKSGLSFLCANVNGVSVGYCVFDTNTGDLTQIAVKQEFRRKGVASELLKAVVQRMNTDFIKVLNVSSLNITLPAFLRSKNILPAANQFEMVLPLG